MAATQIGTVLHHLRRLAGAQHTAGLDDAALLALFARQRDEAAFAALLQRHGPMVFGVCRRVLGDPHDAEDAFQASFLILVRKADAIGKGESLGCWLHEVACRTALRARSNAVKRRARERQARPMNELGSTVPGESQAAQPFLDEELQRLPEQYRRPLLLCYLEGKTHAEAAALLGWPKGTVSGRLARARELLRQRLARRGVTLTATTLLGVLTREAPAAVPTPLFDATLRAGMLFAVGQAAPVSAAAVSLAHEVLTTLITNRVKMAVLSLALIALLGGVTYVLGPAAGAAQGPPPTDGQVTTPAPAAEKLPAGATARLGGTQFRHGDRIFFVAYAPDGKQLVTGSDDGTFRLWDAATGREERRFSMARAVKQGGPLATAGLEMVPLSALGNRSLAALSPDGKVLAATSGSAVVWWDVATGKELHRKQAPALFSSALAFADGGKTVFLSDQNGRTNSWDVTTGKPTRPNGQPKFNGNPVFVAGGSPALSRDGKLLARPHADPANNAFSLKVRDITAGKDLTDIDVGTPPLATQFSPDGKLLVWAGFQAEVHFWDVAVGKALDPLGRKAGNRIASLAFSGDGNRLALANEDGSVEVWDVPARKHFRDVGGACLPVATAGFFALGSAAPRIDLAFSPDGKTLAVGAARSCLRLFEVATGKEVGPTGGGHQGAVRSLGVSADGKTLITHARGEAVRFWDVASGKGLREVRVPGDTLNAALSPDGATLAAAETDGKVVLYDTATGKALRTLDGPPNGPLLALGFSADGKVLTAREQNSRAIRLWDTAGGNQRAVLAEAAQAAPPVNFGYRNRSLRVVTPATAFSPDGKYLAAATANDQLGLWDLGTAAKLFDFAVADRQGIMRFAFSPDGRSLAAVDEGGGVMLYETATGARRARLGKAGAPFGQPAVFVMPAGGGINLFTSVQDFPFGVAFSPDGRTVAAAGPGPAIRLWDIGSGKELGVLEGHQGGVVRLAFAADGKRLFSGSVDGTALTWDAAAVARAAPAKLGGAEVRMQWDALASSDAEAAFQAVRVLWGNPTEAVAMLAGRLKPVPAVDADRVRKLLADLDAKSFAVRQQATAELEKVGDPALPLLRETLAGGVALESRQRLEQLMRKLTLRAPQGENIRGLRAVEVLEHAGTAEVRRVLRTLANGAAGARLTGAAREALTRLGRPR